MHRVAVLAFDSVVAFDLSTAVHAFSHATAADGSRLYDVRVCGPASVSATDGEEPAFALRPRHGLRDATDADTVVVPGCASIDYVPPRAMLGVLRAASRRGVRIASVCTGAFVLAAAGVLDGRRATTHWEGAAELARRYPKVQVDPDVLYVDNDNEVLTSAGVAAGLDMCLYMIGSDFGAAVAAGVARRMVIPMARDGGQAQFIAYTPPADDGHGLQSTVDWMQANLGEPLSLDDIAVHARTSVRTLNRRFKERLGITPQQCLLSLRVQRAKELLETTDMSVEHIAGEVGFGSSVTLRQHFARRVRVPPNRYRAAFCGPAVRPPSADPQARLLLVTSRRRAVV